MENVREKASGAQTDPIDRRQEEPIRGRLPKRYGFICNADLQKIAKRLCVSIESVPREAVCMAGVIDVPLNCLIYIASELARQAAQMRRYHDLVALIDETWPEDGIPQDRDQLYVYVYDSMKIASEDIKTVPFLWDLNFAGEGYSFCMYRKDVGRLKEDLEKINQKYRKEKAIRCPVMKELLRKSVMDEKWDCTDEMNFPE